MVEGCPNCIEVIDKSVDGETKADQGKIWDTAEQKSSSMENLGKPQGILFNRMSRKMQGYREAFS